MRRLVHPGSGMSVPVPEGWETTTVPESDSAVAVEPGEGTDGFRASLVLTVVDNGGLSFRDWQVATDEMLPRVLDDYLLLDLERRTVAGRPGGRRLASHLAAGGVTVTMEQWFALVGPGDSLGCTLTATVETRRYDELADLLGELAGGLG